MRHEELVDLVTRKNQFYSPIWPILIKAVDVCETNLSIIRLLFPKEAEKTSVNTRLLYNAQAGCCDAIVKLLLEKLSFPKISRSGSPDALRRAATSGPMKMINLLLENGADPSHVDWSMGRTSLMWAACSGYLEAVKVLLEKGADPNLKSRLNETALSLSRDGLSRRKRKHPLGFQDRKGKEDVVEYLLKHGVKE